MGFQVSASILSFVKGKTGVEAKALCLWLIAGSDSPDDLPEGIDDFTYLSRVKAQLAEGILPAVLVKRIWEYALGRPMDVAASKDVVNPIAELSNEDLQKEINKTVEVLSVRDRKYRSE